MANSGEIRIDNHRKAYFINIIVTGIRQQTYNKVAETERYIK